MTLSVESRNSSSESKEAPKKLEKSPSKYFQTTELRHYFKKRNQGDRVKPAYQLTTTEQKQKQQIKDIFKKFDFDNSGSLDAKELTELFTSNNYDVDEKAVKSMYGIQGNSVLDLTPEKFEAINKNKDDLKRIRESLKVLKKTTLRKKLMQNLKNMKKTRIVKEK